MLLEKLSTKLGIAAPVIIIQVFRTTKVAPPYCIHLEYYAPDLLMIGSASIII